MSSLKTVSSGQRNLAIVANMGPLPGVLGTVRGMVVSFEALAGLGDPQAVAAGLPPWDPCIPYVHVGTL